MIKEKKPLAMYEVEELLKQIKETDRIKDLRIFLKKYLKIDAKRGKKMEEDLIKLDILKLKERDIKKIIDILPENAIELNKIITEASLDSNETNKVLEAIKSNK